jgi:hypothetical protein
MGFFSTFLKCMNIFIITYFSLNILNDLIYLWTLRASMYYIVERQVCLYFCIIKDITILYRLSGSINLL